MVRQVLLLFLAISCVSGIFVRRGDSHLQSATQNIPQILEELKEMQSSSDAVDILGITGNATLTQVLSDGSSMFWWFINKIGGDVYTDDLPVILWLQGGPGCSSMTGAFFEFGPLFIDENLQPALRPGSWAESYHLIFIDNPFGAGYSIAINKNDYPTNEYEVASNIYTLLQTLTIIHPEFFANHDWYIFGESYAGKYIPSVAYYILNWNGNTTETGNNYIPLAGIAIGDGISDPIVQFASSYSDYGFATGLIDEYERANVEVYESQTIQSIQSQQWIQANDMSNTALELVVEAGGNVNVYNIRGFGDYNSSLMDTWLNSTVAKQTFHVPTNITFLDCGTDSYNALEADVTQSVKWMFPYLLNHTKVMLYEGQDDLILNSAGSEAWIATIPWYGLYEYLQAPKNIWYVDGAIAGYERGFDNLTQVIVLKAGHLVPHDQLQNSLDMATRFIEGLPWGS